ncbi:MAG: hypothetical protein KKF27_20925 [Gammaproteobacteria bacterium]|uniref:Tail protein n=1 Tax=viral metagenome TaxID=1070528 RepID=A0A6M3LFA2_9ZZZZ|nr:hypothetical protein [Gammaproteobacteria bacterium]
MLFQGKDGELRLFDFGLSGTTYYLEILFSEMDFAGPTARPRTEETLIMDRGNFDSNAHYIEGNDEPRYAPLAVSFSCKLADTVNSQIVSDWIGGVSPIGYANAAVSGTTSLRSCKGKTTIDGNTLPNFKDATKQTFFLEVLWSGDNDIGLKYNEIYFPPGEQSIAESADGLTLSGNAQVYGDVTRITGFTAGLTSII